MSVTTRERLERTARIVTGGACPHAKKFGAASVVYCDKPVDPLTGDHVDGLGLHRGDSDLLPVAVRWHEDSIGAFIE